MVTAVVAVTPVAPVASITVAVVIIGTTVPIVAAVPIAAIIPVATTAMIAAPLGMRMLITIADPLFPHKINGPATGPVTSAIPAPVLLVKRGNIEVHRRHADRPRRDNDRLRVDQCRRGIATANVDLPVDAGLIDADGYADLCIDGRHDAGSEGECNQFFHRGFPEMDSL